jgi:hypothetical protein
MKNAIKGIPIVLFVAIMFVASNPPPVRAGSPGSNIADIAGPLGTGCPPPFVPDGWVNFWDLLAIAQYYGLNVPPAPPNPDLNKDGKIDWPDLTILAANWGLDPPMETRTVTASSSTTVYISAPTTKVTVGKTITVNITVSAVSNLEGWQAGMTFNPIVLQCLSVQEGSFLKQGGSTLWVQGAIDNASGIVHYSGCALCRGSTPVNGSGHMAIIKFLCKNAGHSMCAPEDVILANSTAQEITAATSNGTVDVSPAVGGIWVPVDKLALWAPYIALASTILIATIATAIYVQRVKRRKEKQ